MSKDSELIEKLDRLIEQYGEMSFKRAVKTINRRRVDKNRPRREQFPWKEYERLYKKQDGLCAICKEPMVLLRGRTHVDHIDPNATDFNDLSNRQLTHPGCNLSKSSKSIMQQSKTYGKTMTELLGGDDVQS